MLPVGEKLDPAVPICTVSPASANHPANVEPVFAGLGKVIALPPVVKVSLTLVFPLVAPL